MNALALVSRASLVAVASPAVLLGQCRPSTGVFIATPFALSTVEDPAQPFAGGEVYFKDRGFQAAPPARWSNPAGIASFRLLDVFKACGLPRGPFPDVDAVSIGEDWILADINGQLQVPANRWGGLVFSVTSRTRGRAGSVLRRESASTDGAAADLFSWVLPGSAIPGPLVDITERAHDSSEIDLGGNPPDVDAVDLFQSFWAMGAPIRSTLLDPPRVFFSVSNATVNLVPRTWWGNLPPSGASILYVTWSARARMWTCPRVWKSFRDLGLQQSEDVDALAVDDRRQSLLFSTKTRTRDPILYIYCGTDMAIPVPLTDGSGQPVSTKIGLLNDDDIDAICAMDPSVARSQFGRNSPYYAMGSSLPKIYPFPPVDLASSSYRGFDGVDENLETYLSGWPTTGPGPGFAVLALTLTTGPFTLIPVAVHNRDPANPICGDPISQRLPVPPALALTGADVDLRWFVVDRGVTTIGEAYPIRIRL